MARRRIIKPEFWTDGTIVQLPYEARLLFIGMWNFADDYGCLDDEPERIALQILPADDADVEMLVDLLVAAGRIERYIGPDGRWFLYIPHFTEHQKVDHPSKPTYPEIKDSRKVAIPLEARRQVAMKYGCKPGESADATCYYCGAVGSIYWPRTNKGRPGCWVAFSGLELDHFIPESQNGATTAENLVLACRHCNRSKHDKDGLTFARAREDSPIIATNREPSQQVKLSEVKLSNAPTERTPARTQEVTPVPKPQPKPARDPKLDHPAVQAYRDHYKLTPDQPQRALIAECVSDLALWHKTLANWDLSGNKPTNVLGMVDWYKLGGQPYANRNGNGQARAPTLPPQPADAPKTQAEARERAKQFPRIEVNF